MPPPEAISSSSVSPSVPVALTGNSTPVAQVNTPSVGESFYQPAVAAGLPLMSQVNLSQLPIAQVNPLASPPPIDTSWMDLLNGSTHTIIVAGIVLMLGFFNISLAIRNRNRRIAEQRMLAEEDEAARPEREREAREIAEAIQKEIQKKPTIEWERIRLFHMSGDNVRIHTKDGEVFEGRVVEIDETRDGRRTFELRTESASMVFSSDQMKTVRTVPNTAVVAPSEVSPVVSPRAASVRPEAIAIELVDRWPVLEGREYQDTVSSLSQEFAQEWERNRSSYTESTGVIEGLPAERFMQEAMERTLSSYEQRSLTMQRVVEGIRSSDRGTRAERGTEDLMRRLAESAREAGRIGARR